MKNIYLTNHSIERAASRKYANVKSAGKDIELAYKNGLRENNFSGKRRQYLHRKNINGCISIYYKDWIYIFADRVCVTLYRAPAFFLTKVRNGEVIRNFYKWSKFNSKSMVGAY